ncbi:MAG: nuclear transport factor 2 family protein [Gammaproteobacteria bacterium]|jgi:hypothetical protein|nr:nuclear transport factor 2 family protein [Gammaproteobacteria bacterium]
MVAVLLAACSRPAGPAAPELLSAYEAALDSTAASAVAFPPDSDQEKRVLQRLAAYFAPMTAESARAQTVVVYAPNAWLFDNLAVVEGRQNIEDYFVKATTEAESLTVDFQQVARAGSDYFIRWKMSINSPALSAEPIVSYGVTQFRFDADGRVLMHRDFWDAATGLYEYLPGVGGWMERLRNTLGAMPE